MPSQPPADYVEDDGLYTPEVRAWAEEKYRVVALYDTLFSTGMKNKWDARVYIDLNAGAGHARIKGTKHIVLGSPLIALHVPYKFDKYIFCEENKRCINALKKRVHTQFPNVDVEFVHGDCNQKASDILDKIPGSNGKRILSLCFIDPFNIGIHFDTVKCLSAKRMDFLIVLPTGMDATRNQARYFDKNSPRIARFLGKPDWRKLLEVAEKKSIPFRQFLADLYTSQMVTLGYIKVPVSKMKEVRSDDKMLPLYHLAFFSKSERGYEFWNKVLKHSDPQQPLAF
ncbi:MAG: three-Cys-motif partner protein TcmP [Nitrospiraceae bacterium]